MRRFWHVLMRLLPLISFFHKISADSLETSVWFTNQLLTLCLFHSCILLGSSDSSKPDNHITNQHKIVKISPKVNSEWTNRLKIVVSDGPERWMGEMSVYMDFNSLLHWLLHLSPDETPLGSSKREITLVNIFQILFSNIFSVWKYRYKLSTHIGIWTQILGLAPALISPIITSRKHPMQHSFWTSRSPGFDSLDIKWIAFKLYKDLHYHLSSIFIVKLNLCYLIQVIKLLTI